MPRIIAEAGVNPDPAGFAQTGREPFAGLVRYCSNRHKENPMRYLTLLPLLALMILSACETVEGAGRDLETAGEAITEESQDVQAGN